MKLKLLVVSILLMCFCKEGYSQWKPVKTLKGGIGMAVFKDENVLYSMVANFGIMQSMDSGTTWKRILTKSFPFYGTWSTMSVNRNLITVDRLLSVDTGSTWHTLQIPLSNSFYKFFEVFAGKVYYTGQDSMAISSDSGATWAKYKLPHPSYLSAHYNRLMKSNDSLFLVVDDYAIYSTTDSGITWDSICPLPNVFNSLDNLIIKGDTLFCLATHSLYRSTNRGNTWSQIGCCNLSAILFENDSLFLTTNDSLFLSTNLGNTRELIAYKQFLQTNHFIKTGNTFVMPSSFWGILKFDLGSSLFTQNVEGIYGIPVIDMLNVHDSIFIYSNSFFYGSPATIYYSFDNGLSWSFSTSPSPPPPYFKAMTYYDKAIYIIIYKDIYKFDLINQSWSLIGFTQNFNCNDLLIDSSGIYCSDGYVLKFPLQGGAFSTYSTSPLLWQTAINNGYIYGVNTTDVIVSPTTSTPQWTVINSGLPGPIRQGIFAFNNSNVYLGGGKGVYKAQPPLYNWTYTGLFDKGLHKLSTYGNSVFAATHEKGICVLRNDTSTWDPVNFGLPKGNYDSTHIFAFYSLVCSDSGIFTGGGTYPDCGLWFRPYSELNVPLLTSIDENEQSFSALSFYPNPARNQIFINAGSMVTEKNIVFTLSDLQGRTVLQKQYHNNTAIDISVIPAGLYIATLTGKEKELRGKVMVER